MTTYGPWIQDPDYDTTGLVNHLYLPGNLTYFHSEDGIAAPADPAKFQTAWQAAESGANQGDYAGHLGSAVNIYVDTGVIPSSPTTYDGLHTVDPISARSTPSDRYYPGGGRGTPTIPPGWDGLQWEDGVGWSTLVDAVLEKIAVNDYISTDTLDSAAWSQDLYVTSDYAPVTPPLDEPAPDLYSASWSPIFSRSVSTPTPSPGDYPQQFVGANLFDWVTDELGTLVILNTLSTTSAVMHAAVRGNYQWGSFVTASSSPDFTYMRYRFRPPRYRFFKESTVPPARRLWPRNDPLGVGIGRTWPAPNTYQYGRGRGPGSPV